jgi:alkylated DNA repair dioxygenase AlkB
MSPQGFSYQPEFISPAEEASLVAALGELPFENARFREYTAHRRVVTFAAAPPFLAALRERLAAWRGVAAADFRQILINEYRPGVALGWHRDSPEYELVVGVSLGTACRMRFRPYPPPKGRARNALELDLEPRSAYAMQDEVRWHWQHSVPAVKQLRYSITLRTLRPAAAATTAEPRARASRA